MKDGDRQVAFFHKMMWQRIWIFCNKFMVIEEHLPDFRNFSICAYLKNHCLRERLHNLGMKIRGLVINYSCIRSNKRANVTENFWKWGNFWSSLCKNKVIYFLLNNYVQVNITLDMIKYSLNFYGNYEFLTSSNIFKLIVFTFTTRNVFCITY